MNLDSLSQDLRYAARTLGKNAGFTLVAVPVLALGIGATTAIFSLVSAIMLRPLPFVEPDRLVVLWEDASAVGGPVRANVAPSDYVAWKARARSFEDMALFIPTTYNLTGDGEPERLDGTRVTTNFFSLLGLHPILGRTLSPDDEGPDAVPAAIISEDLWIRRFAGDPGMVGRTIRLDGLRRTVVGVVPSHFRFPNSDVAVWVPGAFTAGELAQRNNYSYDVVARLERGTSVAEAQAEMTAIARSRNQQITRAGGGFGVVVTALSEQLLHDARPMLTILLEAVGAVLLITCANVANLLLTRGTGRRKELALRKALGARDGRVVRQLLTESAVLAGLGVALGVALSTLSFAYLARLIPSGYPEGVAPTLDWRVLLATAGIALLTVLLFGMGPALAAGRLDLNEALKKGVGSMGAARGGRVRSGLVVGEIALTVVLLTAAGVLLRSYAQLSEVDPGFPPDHLLIAQTALSPSGYGEPTARADFYERVLERVRALPGVSRAAYVTYPPLISEGGRFLRFQLSIDGRPAPALEDLGKSITNSQFVSPEYLPTLGVPLIRGRLLDERDGADAPRAVVINEAMARVHWPGEDPIGARLRIGVVRPGNTPYTVVGVVGDIRQMGLDMPPEPEVYFSYRQNPARGAFFWPSHLVVRTQGDPLSLAAAVRSAVWEVDPSQPVSRLRTMSDIFDAELVNRDIQLTLIGGFAALAVLLASAGLYAVLSYTVAQRASEIGLRMALGAERGSVVRTVLCSALRLAAFGLTLGIVCALGLTHLLAAFLFSVSPEDPATLTAVTALLLLVTILAAYVPARRAAGVDPISALRIE